MIQYKILSDKQGINYLQARDLQDAVIQFHQKAKNKNLNENNFNHLVYNTMYDDYIIELLNASLKTHDTIRLVERIDTEGSFIKYYECDY